MQRYETKSYWSNRLRYKSSPGGHCGGKKDIATDPLRYYNILGTYGPMYAKRVAEVGCGTGLYLRPLQNQYPMATRWAFDITSSIFRGLGLKYPDWFYKEWDATSELHKARHNSYDVVSCIDVVLHQTEEGKAQKLVENLVKMTKPRGVIFISPVLKHITPRWFFTAKHCRRVMMKEFESWLPKECTVEYVKFRYDYMAIITKGIK